MFGLNSDQATVGSFVVVALAALAASMRWLWPRLGRFFRSLDRMFETINGRPAELDRAGKEVSPAVPSLTVQLADLSDRITDQATQNKRITAVEAMLGDYGKRLDRLEGGAQLERLAARADSHQAFKAIEAIASQEQPETSDD